jgi:hypothetical protein
VCVIDVLLTMAGLALCPLGITCGAVRVPLIGFIGVGDTIYQATLAYGL